MKNNGKEEACSSNMSIVFAPMVSGFVAFCKKICSHMCCSSYMSSTYFSDCSKFRIIIVLCLGFGFAIFEMRSHKSCLGKWWAFCWDLWDVT